jgi:hypothetical protein
MAFKMKGFPMIQGSSPAKRYNTPEKYKVFNMGNKPDGPFKQDDTPGSQNPKFPEVVYTIDGKAVKSIDINEGRLDLKPSIGPKGKYVNYDKGDGTKIKYYYKNPVKAPDQGKFSDLEKYDDDKN